MANSNNGYQADKYYYDDKYDRFAQEVEQTYVTKQERRKSKAKVQHVAKKSTEQIIEEIADTTGIEGDLIAEHSGLDGDFSMTYTPARYEAGWMLESLREFYQEDLISDVLSMVKGGKEASVYCCKSSSDDGHSLVAAKVYRPRQFRNLRNDKMYREGRTVLTPEGKPIQERDRRMKQAMLKGTNFGAQMRHTSWLMYEFTTLEKLHQAGGAVPAPIAAGENALLMSYIGDANHAAPTLHEVRLDRAEAQDLFAETLRNIHLLLQHNLIHGDLSAFNILYWEGEITLIDFPQVVNGSGNPNAYFILQRDVQRVCDYFTRQGVSCDADSITEKLWSDYLAIDEADAAADESLHIEDLL